MALITSENPRTVTKTYANWWLARMIGDTVKPNTPNQSFSLAFTFVRGNKKEDGTWELSPFQEDVKTISIEDVFVFAANEASTGNMQPAQILEGIITLAGSIAKANGAID